MNSSQPSELPHFKPCLQRRQSLNASHGPGCQCHVIPQGPCKLGAGGGVSKCCPLPEQRLELIANLQGHLGQWSGHSFPPQKLLWGEKSIQACFRDVPAVKLPVCDTDLQGILQMTLEVSYREKTFDSRKTFDSSSALSANGNTPNPHAYVRHSFQGSILFPVTASTVWWKECWTREIRRPGIWCQLHP